MKEIFDLLPSFSGGGKGDIRPNPLRQTDAEYARLSTTLCACGGRLGNKRGWVGSPTWRAKWIGERRPECDDQFKKVRANTKVMARALWMDTQAIENRRFYCVPLFLLPEGVVAVACRTDSRSRIQAASYAGGTFGCGLSLSPRLFVRPLSL